MQKEPNKKTQYILVALVCMIWGGVAYRFQKLSLPEENTVENTGKIIKSDKKSETIQSDSFILALDYPDPFMANSDHEESYNEKRTASTISLKKTKEHSPVLPQTPVKVPALRYFGYFVNSTGSEVARVAIDGKNFSIPAGGVGGGVKIVNIDKDSIRIQFNKQMFMIPRG